MSYEPIIATGTYSGNGTSQTITIGWQPAMACIVSRRTAGPSTGRAISWKFNTMITDNFLEMAASANWITANGITVTSTGFSVGSENTINNSGTTFDWFAIRAGPQVATGTYVGDGVIGRSFAVTGWQPELMFLVQSSGTTRGGWKGAAMGANDAFDYAAQIAFSTVALALASNGFQTGSANPFNTSPEDYHWFAATLETVTRSFRTVTYSGDGAADQTITLGQQPKFVWILDSTGLTAGCKIDTMPAEDYGLLDTNYTYEAGTATGIQITSTGFIVGSDFNATGTDYEVIVGID